MAGRSTRGTGGARQVCLLGAGGFIGSHLVEWLLENSDVEVIGTKTAFTCTTVHHWI